MITARAVLPPLLVLAACGTPPAPRSDPALPTPPTTTSAAPACPESGVAVSALESEAAMGLRVLTLQLVNCGAEPYTATGYPDVRLLDAEGVALDVRVLRGPESAEISAVESFAAQPREVVLEPGERATAALLWRNTYDDTHKPPQVGVGIDVAPVPDAPRQAFTPRLAPNGEVGRVDSPAVAVDLGSTGRIGVSPWTAAR